MHPLQSQSNILNLHALLETLICMNSLPKPIMCRMDHLFSYHVTSVCVRTNPPSHSGRSGCQFKLSSEPCFVSTQNRCHMDM
jgi:hypothetical protein